MDLKLNGSLWSQKGVHVSKIIGTMEIVGIKTSKVLETHTFGFGCSKILFQVVIKVLEYKRLSWRPHDLPCDNSLLNLGNRDV